MAREKATTTRKKTPKLKPPVVVHDGKSITMRRCTDYTCNPKELAGLGGALGRNEAGDPMLTFKTKKSAEKAFAMMFNDGALNVREGRAANAIYLSGLFQPK